MFSSVGFFAYGFSVLVFCPEEGFRLISVVEWEEDKIDKARLFSVYSSPSWVLCDPF